MDLNNYKPKCIRLVDLNALTIVRMYTGMYSVTVERKFRKLKMLITGQVCSCSYEWKKEDHMKVLSFDMQT